MGERRPTESDITECMAERVLRPHRDEWGRVKAFTDVETGEFYEPKGRLGLPDGDLFAYKRRLVYDSGTGSVRKIQYEFISLEGAGPPFQAQSHIAQRRIA